MTKEIGPGWYGMLTVNNIEQVVQALQKLLEGKRYTFVAVNMYGTRDGHLIHKPEVYTGQRLKDKNPISFWDGDNRKYSGFNVNDSYAIWSCSTNLQEDVYDPEFNNPHFIFEWDKVTITHRAPAGHLLYWVIAVEKEEND